MVGCLRICGGCGTDVLAREQRVSKSQSQQEGGVRGRLRQADRQNRSRLDSMFPGYLPTSTYVHTYVRGSQCTILPFRAKCFRDYPVICPRDLRGW